MMRDFELDRKAAEEANTGGKRITEPGVYTGKFRAAWHEQNDKGTESVNLIFASDSGQECSLVLYVYNNVGQELPSYKMLNAIMACMRVRKLEAKKGRVSIYDFDRKADVEREKVCYPAMTQNRIGLVLQAEEYENRDGDTKTRLLIAAPFEAESRKMADEVLSSAPEAKALDRFLGWFEKHKVKPLLGKMPRNPSMSSQPDDDEIPF